VSRRRLRPDELALWQSVASTTERLHPSSPGGRARAEPPPTPPKGTEDRGPPVKFDIGQSARTIEGRHDILPGLAERIATAPLRMDPKAHARLKRGKLAPEARIDLHGMTLDRARGALTSFLLSCHAQDRRLVLVITGKGRHVEDLGPIPMRPGALRHNVPLWLQAPPLSQVVLQVVAAHPRHGGAGACYVWLRRKR